jgi:hypothetical protein
VVSRSGKRDADRSAIEPMEGLNQGSHARERNPHWLQRRLIDLCVYVSSWAPKYGLLERLLEVAAALSGHLVSDACES